MSLHAGTMDFAAAAAAILFAWHLALVGSLCNAASATATPALAHPILYHQHFICVYLLSILLPAQYCSHLLAHVLSESLRSVTVLQNCIVHWYHIWAAPCSRCIVTSVNLLTCVSCETTDSVVVDSLHHASCRPAELRLAAATNRTRQNTFK